MTNMIHYHTFIVGNFHDIILLILNRTLRVHGPCLQICTSIQLVLKWLYMGNFYDIILLIINGTNRVYSQVDELCRMLSDHVCTSEGDWLIRIFRVHGPCLLSLNINIWVVYRLYLYYVFRTGWWSWSG